MTGKALVAVTATGPSGGCLRRRQPYGQEVGPVANCKRRLRVQLVATVAATGVLTATAVAATVDGDDGPKPAQGLARGRRDPGVRGERRRAHVRGRRRRAARR